MHRRNFIKQATALSAATLGPFSAPALPVFSRSAAISFPHLNRINQWLSSPVIIKSIEVLEIESADSKGKPAGFPFIRVREQNGASGIIPANDKLPYLRGLLDGLVIPFFIGKDAREIERWVDEIYYDDRIYKFAGMPLWNCVAHVELAILDLLGRLAQKPVYAFFGDPIREEIPVYLSTFDRVNTAEVYVANVQKKLAETSCACVKLKIGGRMSKNKDCLPGRTEALIPLARKTLGDSISIAVDSNGSFDAPRGIEIGRLLQDNRVAFYEEPSPWQDYSATKQIADELSMPVAGGEQDNSLTQWAWMIENRVIDLAQPDSMYNGGFIRMLQVARLAAAAGLPVTPHSPREGALELFKLHLAAIAPNFWTFAEHNPKWYNQELYEAGYTFKDGRLSIPQGPGWGATYHPAFWKKAGK